MIRNMPLVLLALLVLVPIMTAQQAVDLSNWVQEVHTKGGLFNLDPPRNTATFFVLNSNEALAVAYGDFTVMNKQIQCKIMVDTTSDDDFIGFVLGYQPGDLMTTLANYLLVDWKQLNQSATQGYARQGLALSRVTGPGLRATNGGSIDFWSHVNHVDELARGQNLTATGWVDNQEYLFEFTMTPKRVLIRVDGNVEFDVTGDFQDGRFGFYNYSQAYTVYKDCSIISPTLTAVGAPSIGKTVKLGLLSTSDPTRGYVLAPSLATTPPIPLGGNRFIPLQADDVFFLSFLVSAIFQDYQGVLDSMGRGTAQLHIPSLSGLVGTKVYHAYVVIESGAPNGIGSISAPLPLEITR